MNRLPPFTIALALALALSCSSSHLIAQSAPLPPGSSDAGSGTARQPPQAADALTDAETRLEARDYPAAIALLDTYLAAHPSTGPAGARALFDRGYAEDAQDQQPAAEADYRKAIAIDPQQFEAQLALGMILASRSPLTPALMADARAHLEAALALTPQPANPAAQAQAGRALARLLRQADPEAARQALLGALKLSPQTPADALLTGEIAEAAGDPETAGQAYRRVLAAPARASDPQSQSEQAEAAASLAHLLIAQHNYPEADTLLRKALVSAPGNPALNAQLASVLVAENKQDEALAILEKLHQADPHNLPATRMLADLYTQASQPARADPLYAQLLNSPGAPPDAALLAARGDNLVRQQRNAEAIPVLEQAVKLAPEDGNAWSSLAFAASEAHQPQLTLDALAMRSKVMPETPATYFLAATSCDTLHQTKRAVELYRQFLAVAGGKFPDEEWQAKHRLVTLTR